MTLCPHCGQPMPESKPNAAAFDAFWAMYPHKIGKKAAYRAYQNAMNAGVSQQELLEGVARYIKAKPPNLAWCNPTTFLHQARWLDQPAYIDTTQKPEPPKQDGFEIWRVRIRNYLKDGSWPQIAPPLEQCPLKVRDEFASELDAKRQADYDATLGQIEQVKRLFGNLP